MSTPMSTPMSHSPLTEIRLPDLGDFHDLPVIEINVAVGDLVAAEQTILIVESDKATMDIPTPVAGRVVELKVALGDKLSEGSLLLLIAPADAAHPDLAPAVAVAPVETVPVIIPVPVPVEALDEPLPPNEHTAQHTNQHADLHADFLVIGAGPGGYTAAFRAADLGRSVVLIDRWDKLGGVCLNVGCIPSKALLHVAKTIRDAESMSSHGVRFAAPQIDLDALRTWKDSVVTRLTGGLVDLARRRKVKVLHGTAHFSGSHTVTIDTPQGPRCVSFDQAIIAAGSEPVALPFLPHSDPRVIDSTGGLALDSIPERFLVIGGGIIGLEMATVYAALGSRVTVVELSSQIIPGADRDLVAPLFKRLSSQCEKIALKTKVTRIEPQTDCLVAHMEGPEGTTQERFDRVLVAVGRTPNGKALGAEIAGVTVASNGTIPVDAQMRTNVAHIFAIGDVVGQPMLAHKATHEAKVAAEAACGHKVAFEARVIPAVAYTDPEVAWVGLTESEAVQQNIAVEKASFPWAASGRSLALGRDEGLTKVLFDRTTKRLLGVGIVGTNAGDLIAEAALAIEMGADQTDISLTIHPHPTLSETIGLAAEMSAGTITDLFLPKR